MSELARESVRDIPAGRREFIAASTETGMSHFTVTYDTSAWPAIATDTVALTLFVKRGTRGEIAVWSDIIEYKRAEKRDTVQVAGATIDGGVPDSSSVRFEVNGPALRTSVVLEGD